MLPRHQTCACLHDKSSFSEIRTTACKSDYRPSDLMMSNYAKQPAGAGFVRQNPTINPNAEGLIFNPVMAALDVAISTRTGFAKDAILLSNCCMRMAGSSSA